MLRAKLRRLRADAKKDIAEGFEPLVTVRGHTHDEIITEAHEDDVEQAKAYLKGIMNEELDWTDGLPLVTEVTSHWAYTKSLD